jgi:subtilase family serine protease
MKFQRIPLSIAAASLFTLAQLASAQADEVPGKVIVPESSIEHPWDIGQRAHTNISIVIPDKVVLGANRVPVAENPASLACIYGLVKKTTGCPKTATILPTGGAKAIALVDAYDNPDAVTDLSTFAAAYGYRTPNFTVVKMGSPAANAGWALEESLDIEYAFGMAPDAKIYLVEANSDSLTDLFAAEDKATALVKAAGGGEISNSWCGGDFPGEDTFDTHFQAKGVVYFASAGDSGGEVCYPSASPYVVSVGGTTILRNAKGLFTSETAWRDAGGGPSHFETRPTYQNVIQSIVGTQRGTPDISADASSASHVEIYSHYACGGWCGVYGTSISSPTLAGIINAAGSFHTSTDAELTEAYGEYGVKKEYKTDFTDITTGSNGYACEGGWDFCSGIGVPKTYRGK